MKKIELINASAGSGKTYSLTQRVLDAISKGVAPEALMATTFTNRAAAELRERIRVQLIDGDLPEESGRVRDGFIGTVNSICGRLLKEYALEAGLSPAVEIMPDEDSGSIFRISVDRVIESMAVQMEAPAQRLELTGEGGKFRKSDDWRDGVERIVNYARSNQIAPDQLKDMARRSWKGLEAVLGKTVEPGPDGEMDLSRQLQDAMKTALDQLSKMEMQTKTSAGTLDTLRECHRKSLEEPLPWSDWCRLSKLKPGKAEREIFEPVSLIAGQVLRHPQLHADLNQIITGAFECAMDALLGYDQYKREHGLMDFIDQESQVLDIARRNQAFRDSMKDRIDLLMVDEFQDTSPIQLALFLTLNELAGRSVWVGDPKQAIYSFRGTDPKLMEEVVSRIDQSQVLGFSWRSKENLIAFSNALFSQAFYNIGREKVCLTVPPERREKAKGGAVETWHLAATKKADELGALANGIRDLLERKPELLPGDIGVLCRTNQNCGLLAAKLEALGIRASAGQGRLIDTRECRLALAALRYLNNPADHLALAELISTESKSIGATSADSSTAASMPPGDWLSDLMEDPEATKKKWATRPLAARLGAGRENLKFWTPLEALEEAIARADLLRTVKSWHNPRLAAANLDALRAACHEYMDLSTARRSAATVDGFLNYMKNAESEQAKGMDETAVNVLTYHAAKGLEWPWVVLADLDQPPKSDVFGVNVDPAATFDIDNPLADRTIRFWPWPFGSQKQFGAFTEKVEALPLSRDTREKALQEAQRLLYVGVTRGKDGLVMALRRTENKGGEVSLKTQWMDTLTGPDGNPIIKWPLGEGKLTLQVGTTPIQVESRLFGREATCLSMNGNPDVPMLPDLPVEAVVYPPARISPSGQTGEPCGLDGAAWRILHRFDHRLTVAGDPQMDQLGSAVHGYFGADSERRSPDQKQRMAENMVKNWSMEGVLDPAELIASGNQLLSFLATRYPDAIFHKEWPMTLRDDRGQHMQGWMDLLVELPDGYVLLDHKNHNDKELAALTRVSNNTGNNAGNLDLKPDSHPDVKPMDPDRMLEESMKQYLPQMDAYIRAIETATGKPVLETLLHLPIQGVVLELCPTGTIVL